MTQSGGTNAISSILILGYGYNSWHDATGTYNLSGGSLYAPSEDIGSTGTGTFTQSGGTNSVGTLLLGVNSGSAGTYNLNGGTLITNSIIEQAGTAAFNFGGGTLQAGAAFSTSVPMTLTGTGGNANVNTAGYAVTLAGQLSGPGGLNKLGANTLTLSAANTYSGDTQISGGTLTLANANALQNSTLDYNSYGGTLSFDAQTAATFGGLKGNQNLDACQCEFRKRCPYGWREQRIHHLLWRVERRRIPD